MGWQGVVIWLLGAVTSFRPAGLPDQILREVPKSEPLPRGRYTFVRAWEAEGRECGHRTGRRVADREASGGEVWEVKEGRDEAGRHALYGPYVELREGDYVAFLRLKLLGQPVGEVVAEIDACVDYGNKGLNLREIADVDLKPGKFYQIPLPFHYPGGKLEVRLFWRGVGTLRIDKVSLFRVEGAKLEEFIRRAPRPVPSGKPSGLSYWTEPRPFPDLFPRSKPPSRRLVVADIRRLPPDWQRALFTLQGLVNRERPVLYFIFNDTDEFWLDWMLKRGFVGEVERVKEPRLLPERFRRFVKGVVVYDPLLPATKNVAAMLAGVKDCLVASPRLARELPFPVVADLRGRWERNADAYRWAFSTLWEKLNHHVAACSYPDHIGLLDYLVQHRIPIFWVSGPLDGARRGGDPQAEVRLAEQLLAKLPPNIPIMSYPFAGVDVGMGEGPGVTLFSEFGKFLVGSINCTNLSVHSGVPLTELRQKPAPPPPPLEEDKVYFSFVISDGDNLPVLTNYNFPPLWRSPIRGEFPVGWTISPSAVMLIPDIVDYYYETATSNDRFLGAVSGIGYMYPDHYGKRFKEPDRERVFDGFLSLTAKYMERMGLRELWVMGAEPGLIRRYAEKIPFLRALFPDYGRRIEEPALATYPTARKVPVFHAVTGWRPEDTREERIERMVREIRKMTPPTRPAFLHVFVWNWGFDLGILREVARRLGPNYVPVRPDHLAALYGRWLSGKHVLVRAPSNIVALEGQRALFAVTVQNVTGRPLLVRPEVMEGLREAKVEPREARLGPSEEAQFAFSGVPEGRRLKMALRHELGEDVAEVSLSLIGREELDTPLPKGMALRFVAEFEAERLPHRLGEEVGDPKASGGKAWAAYVGKPVGRLPYGPYIVFGPYRPLPEGRYLALFRLKRLGEGRGLLVTLDTCVGGGSPVTASLDVRCEQLPVGQYRWFALPFSHPGGGVETRVLWHGNASVAVDCIAVFAVEAKPQEREGLR